MESSIGLNYRSSCEELFTFCLNVTTDGKTRTHAFVDFVNGIAVTIGAVPALQSRKPAILRLAGIYQRRHQA
jgi:hypothetical protein